VDDNDIEFSVLILEVYRDPVEDVQWFNEVL